MSVPGATNEAGNLASTCGTSNSFGKVRTSAESSADIEPVQEHRRLALIFENIAQGVEPTIDNHTFASKNARIVAEFLNKAPLNAGGGDVCAVLDFAASSSPHRLPRTLRCGTLVTLVRSYSHYSVVGTYPVFCCFV